jgi:hypothetical protein
MPKILIINGQAVIVDDQQGQPINSKDPEPINELKFRQAQRVSGTDVTITSTGVVAHSPTEEQTL